MVLNRLRLRRGFVRNVASQKLMNGCCFQYTTSTNMLCVHHTATKSTLFHNVQWDACSSTLVINGTPSFPAVSRGALIILRKNMAFPTVQSGAPVAEFIRPEQNILATYQAIPVQRSLQSMKVVNNDSFRLGPGDRVCTLFNVTDPNTAADYLFACTLSGVYTN